MYLVDANILIYSTDEDSEHHVAARDWLDQRTAGAPGPSACPGPACSPSSGLSPTRVYTHLPRRRRMRGSALRTGCPGQPPGSPYPDRVISRYWRDRPGIPPGWEPRAGRASGRARPRARPHRRLDGYGFRQVSRRRMAQPRLSRSLMTTSQPATLTRARARNTTATQVRVREASNTPTTRTNGIPRHRRHDC